MTSRVFGEIRDGALQQRANGDLVLCLMSVMPDRTIFAFSRTCRLLYELARPQMKRRRLRFQYTCFDLRNAHPCGLFELLEEQPEALPYIKTLNCQPWFLLTSRRTNEWGENLRRVRQGQHNDILPFIRQFCALPYIRGLSASERLELESENEPWKVTLVLASAMLCPNLELLRFEGGFAQIAKAMTPIIRYVQSIENDHFVHNRSNTTVGQLASKLKWLTVLGEFASTGVDEMLRVFSLPSLRRAIISDIVVRALPDRPITFEFDTSILTSSIERLTLTQCDIKPGSLKALIEHMPNLEWLRHHDMNEYEHYVFLPNLPVRDLGVSANGSAVLETAFKSLQETQFHDNEGIDAYAKLLALHVSCSPKLLRRDLTVSAVADELFDWDRPSIIVKKPQLSSRDIGYGTLSRPRFV